MQECKFEEGLAALFASVVGVPDDKRREVIRAAKQMRVAFQDKTEENEQLQKFLLTDPKTGAANEQGVMFDMIGRLESMKRYDGLNLAVVYFDLDGFKAVNDSLGHDQGDQVFRDVVKTMKKTFRATDTIARLGGDEFMLVLSDETPFPDEEIKGKIRTALEPLVYEGRKGKLFPIGASIGIAHHAREMPFEDNAEALAHKLKAYADAAMYQDKEGKGQRQSIRLAQAYKDREKTGKSALLPPQ